MTPIREMQLLRTSLLQQIDAAIERLGGTSKTATAPRVRIRNRSGTPRTIQATAQQGKVVQMRNRSRKRPAA